MVLIVFETLFGYYSANRSPSFEDLLHEAR